MRRPERWALAELRKRGSKKGRETTQRYFKHPVSCFGLSAPSMRRVARELLAQVDWSLRDAMAFCERMHRESELDAKQVGVECLIPWQAEIPASSLPRIRRWIRDYTGNWASIDHLVPAILSPLLVRNPGLVKRVVSWTGSKNMWLRRAAAVAFVKPARKGRFLDAAYRVARLLSGDDEDLLHKATGWMLREAGTTDAPRLKKFLRSFGHRLPRTAVRYSIERFSKAERQKLLAATKKA